MRDKGFNMDFKENARSRPEKASDSIVIEELLPLPLFFISVHSKGS